MVELIIGIIFLLIGFLGVFVRFDWVCKKSISMKEFFFL